MNDSTGELPRTAAAAARVPIPRRSTSSIGRHHRLLVIAFAIAALGGECTKPDWLSRLEHSVDVAVPRLEAALDQLAADLPAAVARLDAVAARRLIELDATLRDAVDGLNHVLASNRERLDAALAARVEQLASIATAVAADAHAVALGLSTRISATTSELLVSTRLAAQRLLADLDVQLARVTQEGDRVVADVYSASSDLIVRIAGLALLVLGLIGGSLVFVIRVDRRRGVTLGLQVGLTAIVIAAGALVLLSSRVRAQFVPIEPVVIDHPTCPAALAASVAYLGRYRTRVTPDAVAEASEVMPAVASCLVVGGSEELSTAATARLAEIRRLLGIEHACTGSATCEPGETCEAATGACVRRCTAHRDCTAGELCHPMSRTCSAPCTTACPRGGTCRNGTCQMSEQHGPRIIGGGRGWFQLAACDIDRRGRAPGSAGGAARGIDRACARLVPGARAVLDKIQP